MVQILVRGTKDICKCGKCGSELRFTDSDVQLKFKQIIDYYDEIEPEDNQHPYIICPACHSSVPISLTRAEKRQHMARLANLEMRRDHDL